ncbi:unnamed protein product [Clonostachys rosea]|uniref:AB hydrolase-1 domain-containing protein n=1 Tax=Bionectria ochroleuca TaxID=29856 RepID=A0ABY6U9L4_BIOOC|nr:unnamed protein product [Clonostachys rosea]
MSSPIFVLVPGAFGTPSAYDKLVPYLEKAGFATMPEPYPSCNHSNPSIASCQEDITSLREKIILPILEQGSDVILVVHSYGGAVGGAAATGLDKKTRAANGLPGGVIGLIYIAGNVLLEGESLIQAVGGAYPPYIKTDKPSPGLSLIEPAMDVLYNDCGQALAPELEAAVKPHAQLAFETGPTAPAWADAAFEGRRTYIRTEDDCCIPASLQDAWMEKSGVKWDVVHFKSSHMPFVSKPKDLAEQLVKSANGYLAL